MAAKEPAKLHRRPPAPITAYAGPAYRGSYWRCRCGLENKYTKRKCEQCGRSRT